MTARAATFVALLTCSGCFSPDPYEALDGGDGEMEDSSSGVGDEPVSGGEATRSGESTQGGSEGDTEADSSEGEFEEDMEAESSGDGVGSSTGGDGSSDDVGGSSTGESVGGECGDGIVDAAEDCDDGNRDDFDGCDQACAWETCGYAFTFIDGACRTGVESFCVPDSVDNEMHAACEACTGVPCEEQVCALGFPANAGTIWTPTQTGGGYIEHPMGFVDLEIRHSIFGTWARGTILADACSSTQIGDVQL